MGAVMKDDDWLISLCQDLCAYAEKNNLRNVTSAAEHALEVAIQETKAATQLKRLVNSSQHVGTVHGPRPIAYRSCGKVTLFPTGQK